MRKNTVVLFFLLLSFGIFFFPEMLNAQSDRYTGISKLNSGYWVKIRISESGIYQISYADLRAWGFVDPAKVKLYGYGGAMLPEDFQKPYIDDLPEVPVMRRLHTKEILIHSMDIIFCPKMMTSLERWRQSLQTSL